MVGKLDEALLVLSSQDSELGARLQALRYLHSYLHSESSRALGSNLRRKINELVMNNILSIAMSDDRTANLTRRQMVRTECFVMLASLLDSNVLFGNDLMDALKQRQSHSQGSDVVLSREAPGNEVIDVDSPSAQQRMERKQHNFQNYPSSSLSPIVTKSDNSSAKMSSTPLTPGSPVAREMQRASHSKLSKMLTLTSPPHSLDYQYRMDSPVLRLRQSVSANAKIKPQYAHDYSQDLDAVVEKRPRPALGPPGGWVRDPLNGNNVNHNNGTHLSGSNGNSSFGNIYLDALGSPSSPREMEGELGGKVEEMSFSSLPSPLSISSRHILSPYSVMTSPTKSIDYSVIDVGHDMSSSSIDFRDDESTRSHHFKSVPSTNSPKSKNNVPRIGNNSSVEPLLMKPLLSKIAKNRGKLTSLKPRTSMFFDTECQLDGIFGDEKSDKAYNWDFQDKRLGYQMPKTWFPFSMAHLSTTSIIPQIRPGPDKELLTPDGVVEEYLQMKALVSYLGDLVAPYSSPTNEDSSGISLNNSNLSPSKISPIKSNMQKRLGSSSPPITPQSKTSPKRYKLDIETGGYRKRTEGKVDEEKYTKAIQEAISIWSPLLGAALPPSYSKGVSLPVSEDFISSSAEFHEKGSMNASAMTTESNSMTNAYEKAVIITKGVLRRLLREELSSMKKTRGLLKDSLDSLVQSASDDISLDVDEVQKNQIDIVAALQDQRDIADAGAKKIQTLMQETIKIQYASLPPRFLLIVEGKKSNPRLLLSKMTQIFFREKRRSVLSLAFGIMKIQLVGAQLEAKQVTYRKCAAIHLLFGCIKRQRHKYFVKCYHEWRKMALMNIFFERTFYAVKLQKLLRMGKERRRLLRSIKLAPYNGPRLSDIDFGPYRKTLPFALPKAFREFRRMIWKAAIIIQTNFRCYILFSRFRVRRQQIIKLQSVCRMCPKLLRYRLLKRTTIKAQSWFRRTFARNNFLYLKKMTIFAQKIVRGYLGIANKIREFNRRRYKPWEDKMHAILKIKHKVRKYLGNKRMKRLRFKNAKREWAAVFTQKNWYRARRAFHTFILMRAYRAREILDAAREKALVSLRRKNCAKTIQRIYRIRFQEIYTSKVIRVQCWWRSRYGIMYVKKKRLTRWASRKLYHWARVMMKRRHAASRRIQNIWWNWRQGNRLKHLQNRKRLLDRREDEYKESKKFYAASRIQAYIKGIWCRIWFKRDRAASKIQRPILRWLTRKRYRRMKRDEILLPVRKYVHDLTSRALYYRTLWLLKYHSELWRRPQSLVRGWLLRRRFGRAMAKAKQYGLAVVTIQRFWRRTGAMSKAVSEVLALRRMLTSPFARCTCLHELLLLLRQKVSVYFHPKDPRVGLSTLGLFYRMGALDMLDLFPKKYKQVSDLKGMNMSLLRQLFDKKQTKLARQRSNMEAEMRIQGGGKSRSGKNKNALASDNDNDYYPQDFFSELLVFVRTPLFTNDKMAQSLIASISAIPESGLNPDVVNESISSDFLSMFGNRVLSRAHNFARFVVEDAWGSYNNYKMVGAEVRTLAQVRRAMNTVKKAGKDAATVREVLQELRTYPSTISSKEVNGDLDWDKERVQKAVDLLQLAMEKAVRVMSQSTGMIMRKLEGVMDEVAFFKRRFALKITKQKMLNANSNTNEARPSVAAESVNEDNNQSVWGNDRIADLTIEMTLQLDYDGPQVASMQELELNVGICKLYCRVLDQLYNLTIAVQKLKEMWRKKGIQRAILKERTKKMMAAAMKEYLDERDSSINRVHSVWMEERMKEKVVWHMQAIADRAAKKKEVIEKRLSTIPLYGWIEITDDDGVPGWANKMANVFTFQYEMPTYTYEQYLAVAVVQRNVSFALGKIREKKKMREDAKRLLIEKAEREWALEDKKTKRQLLCSISYLPRDVGALVTHGAPPSLTDDDFLDPEMQLPFRLKWTEFPVIVSGVWAFMPNDKIDDHPLFGKQYIMVTCFSIREVEGIKVCDTKDMSGTVYENVPLTNIRQMNLEKGAEVECRFEGQFHFYLGIIEGIRPAVDGVESLYTIRYANDNVVETNVSRFFIRPSEKTRTSFFVERRRRIAEIVKLRKKTEFYHELKRQRECNVLEIVQWQGQQFASKWKDVDEAAFVNEKGGVGRRGYFHAARGRPEPDAGSLYFGMVSAYKQVRKFESRFRFGIKYVRRPLKFGWVSERLPDGSTIYNNVLLSTSKIRVQTTTMPSYTAKEDFYARKIQSLWAIRKAKMRFWTLLNSVPLLNIVNSAIKTYQKFAFVGHENEGVTCMQWMRRAGYWEIADTIEKFHSHNKTALTTMTMNRLSKMTTDQMSGIGVREFQMVKDFKEMQLWWKKTTPKRRAESLEFINYVSGPDDNRSVQEAIADSEEVIYNMFTKFFPTSVSRTRIACHTLCQEALFPHTKAQLEVYLKKYNDNVEAARINIHELIGKPTTHTYVEEKEALSVLLSAAKRICTVTSRYKITSIAARVRKAIDLANLVVLKGTRVMISTDSDNGIDQQQAKGAVAKAAGGKGSAQPSLSRALCPGPEGRAAHILRVHVLDFTLKTLKYVLVLQRRIRGFVKRSIYLRVSSIRRKAATLIQTTFRGFKDRELARHLRELQLADWEQLWDNKRNVMYYFNRITGESKFTEPRGLFRPLVRDRRSARLVQAWPHLDKSPHARESIASGNDAEGQSGADQWTTTISPVNGEEGLPLVSKNSLCVVCNIRRCTRFCFDCATTTTQQTKSSTPITPYCFPCFQRMHESDKQNHKYKDVTQSSQEHTSLQCCMCEQPATRKCQGILNDALIDSICIQLQYAPPDRWNSILQNANVGGIRKLNLLLENYTQKANTDSTKKEETGSNEMSNDDSFIDDKVAKKTGPTSPSISHHTSNMQQYLVLTMVQLQKVRTMLESIRSECDECYCVSCYDEVHAGGKRAAHLWIGFQEHAPTCRVCLRTPASHSCIDCSNTVYCDSCFKVFHSKGKKKRHRKEPIMEDIEPGYSYCQTCQRRKATRRCDNADCVFSGCDSCFTCMHKPSCDSSQFKLASSDGGGGGGEVGRKKKNSPGKEETKHSSSSDGGSSSSSSSGGDRRILPDDPRWSKLTNEEKVEMYSCCVCGELPDQICLQCGDLYCSKTWMGNPGCFAVYHSKGLRAKHSCNAWETPGAVVPLLLAKK